MTYNKKGSPRRYRRVVVQGTASEATTLMGILTQLLPKSSRTTHKQYLRDRCIKVNGQVVSEHSAPIAVGDEVVVYSVGFAPVLDNTEVKVLWQDDWFILVQKEPGIPTIASKPGDKHTVYRIVADHYKSGDAREKIFLLNRLDRDTRGLILFARDREVQQEILDNWEKYILSQTFAALVEGALPEEKGEFALPPKPKKPAGDEDTKKKVVPSRRSRATYQVEERASWRTLLRISLLGRYNGIRSQLNEKKCPLVGERKSVIKGAPSIALSQQELVLLHPVTKEKLHFESPVPAFFYKLLRRRLTTSERQVFEKRTENEKNLSIDSLKKID
jgi:ribosomal large subunit pseudouridine synthase family protein